MRERLRLGAPGVYALDDEPVRALTGERMDVAGFVGVAPRGPARLPAFDAPWASPPRGPDAPGQSLRSIAVPVDGWDEYRRLFGGFEGPGLLPYAVAAFFEQGGRRAYVVRVVHDYGEGAPANGWATASGDVPGAVPRGGGTLRLRARSEGSWGNRLRAALRFRARPLAFDAGASTGASLVLDRDAPVPAGTLLRLWLPGGFPLLRFVTDVREEWAPGAPLRLRHATLEAPAGDLPERAEVVEGVLEVADGTRDGVQRDERFEGVGLSALHPRWLAAVLYDRSELVHPDPAWIADDLVVGDPWLRDPPPPPADRPQFTCGRDRYAAIVPDDFFDPRWTPGDDQPRSGLHALAEEEEVAVVALPDLYSPKPLARPSPIRLETSLAGPAFAPCVTLPPPPPPSFVDVGCPGGPYPTDGSEEELDGLRRDPLMQLDAIVPLQQRAVELAETLRAWVVLLDVPPGLAQRQVLAWRSRFGSAWAAAYHPWLRVARPDDPREPLVDSPPSAFAAGIVARQELAFGVQHGPANVLAVGPVAVADPVSPRRHDELHQAAVNVFMAERDGVRLTAGRTLSRDPLWRQLSVRRLVTMVGRTLTRQMQWTVFEPNGEGLRDEVGRMLDGWMRQLFRAGAFRGRTPDESFFVRCDEVLNPPHALDLGRLVCHVGVAPAEPLEFIVLTLSREGDGTLLLEE